MMLQCVMICAISETRSPGHKSINIPCGELTFSCEKCLGVMI